MKRKVICYQLELGNNLPILLLNAPVSTPAWPGALQLGWRTGSSWLLDRHDEEAGQLDKGPEDSTEGAQGAGSSSDSTSRQGEYETVMMRRCD